MERVTVWAELVWPTRNVPKLSTAGLGESDPDGMPLPVSGTTEGTTPAEVVLTVSVPVRMPVVVGVKLIPVVQLNPAASVAGHWLPRRLKSPFVVILRPVSEACPELVTVSVCVVARDATTMLPKVNWEGLTESPPTAVPDPSSGTVIGATPRLLTEALKLPG